MSTMNQDRTGPQIHFRLVNDEWVKFSGWSVPNFRTFPQVTATSKCPE